MRIGTMISNHYVSGAAETQLPIRENLDESNQSSCYTLNQLLLPVNIEEINLK